MAITGNIHKIFFPQDRKKPSKRCNFCIGSGEIHIPAYQYKAKNGKNVKVKEWTGICECMQELEDEEEENDMTGATPGEDR